MPSSSSHHAGLTPQLTSALATFEDATPQLLADRELLTRVDRKFLLPRALLEPLLRQLRDDYRLLRATGAPAATYCTCYFDTPERQMYQDHRRGRCPRFKVRLRHHMERRLCFLEIKRKGRGGVTSKARVERPFDEVGLDVRALRFICDYSPFDPHLLEPCVTNEFRRITLVGARTAERLTLDFDLTLASETRSEQLPGVLIVEVKQARFSSHTPAVLALRQLHVREGAISKYCLATARLTAMRMNPFGPALRAIEALSI